MNKQLKRFHILQTSKVIAMLYLIVFAIFLIPTGLFIMVTHEIAAGVMAWLAVLFYALIGFIGTAISCWIYNFVASKIGGIAFDIDDFDVKE